MSKRTQKVKNCIDRMPSYPVHYAPFQRNSATAQRTSCWLSTLNSRPKFGEVSEWLKEHAWKVCIRQRIEGSNPSLTAK